MLSLIHNAFSFLNGLSVNIKYYRTPKEELIVFNEYINRKRLDDPEIFF